MRFSTCHQMRIYLDLVREAWLNKSLDQGMTKSISWLYATFQVSTHYTCDSLNSGLDRPCRFLYHPKKMGTGKWQKAAPPESRESRCFTPSFLVVIGTVELLWARQLIEPFPAISCRFGGSSVGPFTPSSVWCIPVMLQHTALTSKTYRGSL